jgi:hypothetical protein
MGDGKFRGSFGYTAPPDVKAGYDALLHEVCVGYGYCGCMKGGRDLHVSDFIPSEGPVTADQFVEWVFLADNRNPNLGPDTHKRAIRAAFVKHMGNDVVDATRLRWSDAG